MALYQVRLPRMGESVAEATITKWLKAVGDSIALDEELVEIATDKVDSDVTAEVAGILKEQCFKENEVVAVGAVLAVIETEGDLPEHLTVNPEGQTQNEIELPSQAEERAVVSEVAATITEEIKTLSIPTANQEPQKQRYFSPLVRNIAKAEKISIEELQTLQGTGKNGRVTKKTFWFMWNNAKAIQILRKHKP